MKFYKLECIVFINKLTNNFVAYYYPENLKYIKNDICSEVKNNSNYNLFSFYGNIVVPDIVVNSLLNLNSLNINLKKIYDDYHDICCDNDEFVRQCGLFYKGVSD